jgi:D-cysteine desulfhydrase
VGAALEFAAQLESGAVERPAAIHVAAGTLGTVVGLAIGLSAAGLEIPIVAHRITARFVTNEPILRRLLLRTHAHLVSHGAALPPAEAALALITLEQEQFGDGYGKPTPAGAAATERFASLGLKLDPTYTAKAAAGLIAMAGRYAQNGTRGGPPLFWHTLSAASPGHLVRPDTIDALPAAFAAYLRR